MVKQKGTIITTVVFVVSVILGIAIILLPIIAERVNTKRSDDAIRMYEEQAVQQNTRKHEKIFADADQYNKDLAAGVADSAKYSELLKTDSGIMGYIEIPRINIRDPIYHTIEEKVLQKGIGHLPNTSLPVGGKGTHAALSGHRGLPSSKLFTDLDRVREGDIVIIRVFSRTLAYQVYNIEIVEPDHDGGLEIDSEDDLLTLITCTPYAVNTHRLLVHARRTEYKEEMASIEKEFTISESDRILLFALAIVALILAVDIIIILRRRNRSKLAS